MQFDTQDPKAKQFIEQLQELCDSYQYVLTPSLSYTPTGIIPTLNLVNKVPAKVELKKKVEKRKKK